ncbi:MAG: 2-octaprenyl-6-methoxyphenyl hydroxylase [Proteobacteria bacterium SG_bin9]|nr:MAG: 2-octaprenyl-6-methoxyphenyl hydroxylase [Proteobacteria bacterium SG_bin9]
MIDRDQQPSLQHIAVIGGGPVGLATAIALAASGASVTLVARRVPYSDNRTTALLGASVDFLDRIGVWQGCADQAAALQVMRLVDDTGRLIRAPEVRFSSDEIGRDAFGYNIENRVLLEALEQRAGECESLTRIDDDAASVIPDDAGIEIETKSGQTFRAQLVVGADGRNSLCREAAGIAVERRELRQTALTFNVTHTRPHRNTSTEFHTPHGPCVFVPLPGERSSVVWVSRPDEAVHLHALDDAALGLAAERQSHSMLGAMRVDGARFMFPLSIEKPAQLAAKRIVLAGESAHVLPPIGAQGLNMGLRDAADLAEIVTETLVLGGDPGSENVLTSYARSRKPDITSRTFAIDLANRSLLSDLLPLQPVRALGLHLINAIGPLRRLAMREGLAPSWRR